MSKKMIVYVGKKSKISVPLPIGVKSKNSIYEVLTFKPNEPLEVPSEEAKKLIGCDPNFKILKSSDVKKSVKNSTEFNEATKASCAL